MKRRVYQILFPVILAVFLISSGFLVKTLYEYRKAEQEGIIGTQLIFSDIGTRKNSRADGKSAARHFL